jgi:hypothetical protein
MTSNWVVWDWGLPENGCLLKEHSELEDPWDITEGISRSANFPADFSYAMDPEFPHSTLLTDNVTNLTEWIIVSPRLRDFVEQQRVPKLEFLPVTILDHRDRAAANYFLLNPLEPVDCVDAQASGARFSRIDTSRIQEFQQLVLDEQRIDRERPLFKLKHLFQAVLVRRDLADAITSGGFSGIRWKELSAYRD